MWGNFGILGIFGGLGIAGTTGAEVSLSNAASIGSTGLAETGGGLVIPQAWKEPLSELGAQFRLSGFFFLDFGFYIFFLVCFPDRIRETNSALVPLVASPLSAAISTNSAFFRPSNFSSSPISSTSSSNSDRVPPQLFDWLHVEAQRFVQKPNPHCCLQVLPQLKQSDYLLGLLQ